MSGLEWAVQLGLLVLLGGALPFLLRLQQQIAALRRDPALIAEGAAGFERAAREAQASLDGMRAAAEAGGRSITERLSAGEAVSQDLRYMIERAGALADRLEALVGQARPLAAATAGAPLAARSAAERGLLEALARAR